MEYRVYFETEFGGKTHRKMHFASDIKAKSFMDKYNAMNIHIWITDIKRSVCGSEGKSILEKKFQATKVMYDTSDMKRLNVTIPADIGVNISSLIPLLENHTKTVSVVVNKTLKI